MSRLLTGLLMVSFAGFGCVPKTQYEDQQEKVKELEDKVDDYEGGSATCDPNLYLQMKEHAQSLDMLTQELVERNTELSKEVGRLRALEGTTKGEQMTCAPRLKNAEEECDAKLSRTRDTYDDMVKDLKAEIDSLRASLEEAKKGPEKAKKASNSVPNKPKSQAGKPTPPAKP